MGEQSTAGGVKDMNIFQRMSTITNELKCVPKNLTVGWGNKKYSAVGESDVLRAVNPLEAKYGVYSYPLESAIIATDTLTKTTLDGQGNAKESTQFFMRLSVTYRFVNVDNPEEHIDITSYGDGIDSGDKAPGKAMTYAGKYALLKAYKISTGDDPDAEASPENGYQSAGSKGKTYKCAECGKNFNDQRLANDTQRDFGKPLCLACAQKAFQSQQGQFAPR